MKIEKSCGAGVFTREGGTIKFVIIRSLEGFYGYPKGHMEAGESEEQTALREIREETGLDVSLLEGFRTEDAHALVREGRPDVTKQIVYFLAEYTGQVLRAQEGEVTEIRLMTYEEAMAAFQFESSRRILREADAYIKAARS